MDMEILMHPVVLAAVPLLAALVGAWANGYVRTRQARSNCVFMVDRIRITTDYASSRELIPVDQGLSSSFSDYPPTFGLNSLSSEGVAAEKMYVAALLEAQAVLSTDRDIRIKRLKEAVGEIENHATRRNFALSSRVFAREGLDLWRHLWLAVKRGYDLGLPEAPKRQNILPKNQFGVIEDEQDKEEGISVALQGPRNIWLPLEGIPKMQKDTVTKLGMRIARAFGFEDQQEIQALCRAMTGVLQVHLDEADRIRDDVKKSIEHHERIVVEGVVSNSRGSAFSISNRAKLVVMLDGYTDSKNNTVAGDVEIELKLGTVSNMTASSGHDETTGKIRFTSSIEGFDEIVPINFSTMPLVNEGQSHRFASVSSSKISNLPQSQALRDAFNGADRRAYLVFGRIGDGNPHPMEEYTADFLFRSLVQGGELRRRPEQNLQARRRARSRALSKFVAVLLVIGLIAGVFIWQLLPWTYTILAASAFILGYIWQEKELVSWLRSSFSGLFGRNGE